jgi:AcrR family transcriptional regulator
MTRKTRGNTNKRRELVDAAIYGEAVKLFYKKGYTNTSLQDIADALELSRPALYHYISSKEEILARFVEDFTISKAEEHSKVITNPDLSPREKLAHMVSSTARQIAERPLHFRILDRCEPDLAPDDRTRQREAKRVVRDTFVAVLTQGVESGDFHCENIDRAAFALIGMCTWIAWWFPSAKDMDIDATVAEITRMALNSVSAPTVDAANPEEALRAIARMRENLSELERSLRISR